MFGEPDRCRAVQIMFNRHVLLDAASSGWLEVQADRCEVVLFTELWPRSP